MKELQCCPHIRKVWMGNNSTFEALKSNKYYDEFNNRRLLMDASVSSSDKNVSGKKANMRRQQRALKKTLMNMKRA